MSIHDDYDETDLGLCICCEQAAATHADASLEGGVCLLCKTLLDAADVDLKRVPGLGGWQNVARGGLPR